MNSTKGTAVFQAVPFALLGYESVEFNL